MIIGIIVGSIVLFLLIFFFLALYLFYHFTFYSPLKGQLDDYNIMGSPQFNNYREKIIKMIDEMRKRTYEDVWCESFDKLKLHGRIFANKNPKKIAILFHGYRGTGNRDFCGGAKEALELGYTVLLIDQRAHGLSQGHSITFGIRESKDALTWINYVYERFGKDIKLVLIGISMGGAIVLNMADKVAKNVKIIADCPFSSPKLILCNSIKAMKLPVKIFYPLVNLSAILFAHTNMNKMSNYDTIKNAQCKILIIHGDADTVVPYTNSQALANTYPDKIQYELFHGADHGISYMVDETRYRAIITKFLND